MHNWLHFAGSLSLTNIQLMKGGEGNFLGAMSMSWKSPDYVGGCSGNDAMFVELALVLRSLGR